MSVTPIIDHVPQAQTRLVDQYQGKPRISGWLAATVNCVQEVENAIAPVITSRLLYGGQATGAQLDLIGQLVGLPRNGIPDALYLVLILGTIGQNTTDTTMTRVLQVIKTVYQASAVYLRTPNAPCHSKSSAPAVLEFSVVAPQTPSDYWPLCQGIVQASLAAGVAIADIVIVAGQTSFAMAGPQSWVAGFSDVNGQGGGPMPAVAYTNKGQ